MKTKKIYVISDNNVDGSELGVGIYNALVTKAKRVAPPKDKNLLDYWESEVILNDQEDVEDSDVLYVDLSVKDKLAAYYYLGYAMALRKKLIVIDELGLTNLPKKLPNLDVDFEKTFTYDPTIDAAPYEQYLNNPSGVLELDYIVDLYGSVFLSGVAKGISNDIVVNAITEKDYAFLRKVVNFTIISKELEVEVPAAGELIEEDLVDTTKEDPSLVEEVVETQSTESLEVLNEADTETLINALNLEGNTLSEDDLVLALLELNWEDTWLEISKNTLISKGYEIQK